VRAREGNAVTATEGPGGNGICRREVWDPHARLRGPARREVKVAVALCRRTVGGAERKSQTD
jgi:hypothetical protein